VKCWIGLGSNLGHPKQNLERAAALLRAGSKSPIKASPVFANPAVVPKDAPLEWRKDFLNAVVAMDWSGTAFELLSLLRQIETELGRVPAPFWAPRLMDLDLLCFGDDIINTDSLVVPHPRALTRSFVLTPLKHLCSSMIWPLSEQKTVLELSRALPPATLGAFPAWMGILNLTTDSFSDGGQLNSESAFLERIQNLERDEVQIYDLGAESTRPRASHESVTPNPELEWQRLEPALSFLKTRYQSKIFKPLISVDTYHSQTALCALKMGVDILNDVSGLQSPQILQLLSENTDCQYVLTHSLTVPADPRVTMNQDNFIEILKEWAISKIATLQNAGLSRDRIIFDPGIGFGKTAEQSLHILKSIDQFQDLPVRLMVGHSRKKFLNSEMEAATRDPETVGASLALAQKSVDIIRVHDTNLHSRALQSFNAILTVP
jgi:2-amino-4-hydroxy-6-hydroxymethyldihydropteridine diphosphokinase/dihydropteroate synthase